MVLASRSDVRAGRYLLLIVAWTACLSTSGSAEEIFFTVNSTPYDKQMSRVRRVLMAKSHGPPTQVSPVKINEWMNELYDIPYEHFAQWKTPAEVRLAQAADCKGKAIALYDKMRANGAINVRVVIGKRYLDALKTHAWLEWKMRYGTYILDPTYNEMIPRTEWHAATTYIPLYAYEGANEYRAYDLRFNYATVRARNAANGTLAAPSQGQTLTHRGYDKAGQRNSRIKGQPVR
jgi:hypothetical protein